LAQRLGTTVHVSPLRFRLERLRAAWPSATAACLEDWLVDVANARGVRVVERPGAPADFTAPPADTLSAEDLVVAICQLQCLDRPQMVRLAAQLISRAAVDVPRLALVARRERVERVLAALADAALRVAPTHPTWRALAALFRDAAPLRDVILHWTRLAEPIMIPGRPNAAGWRLVA
jgi:hypothetical protein